MSNEFTTTGMPKSRQLGGTESKRSRTEVRLVQETDMESVATWSDGKVLGFSKWAAHLTVTQIRGILTHWEQHHPELLRV